MLGASLESFHIENSTWRTGNGDLEYEMSSPSFIQKWFYDGGSSNRDLFLPAQLQNWLNNRKSEGFESITRIIG